MKLKLDPLTILLVVLVFGAGFTTGWFSKRGEKVEYVDVTNNYHVDVRQDQRQEAYQGQVSVIFNGPTTNEVVQINLLNATNVTVTSSTNTNSHSSYTNRRTE